MPKNSYKQFTLDELDKEMSREEKLEKIIQQLECELREAKEIKGLLLAILKKVNH